MAFLRASFGDLATCLRAAHHYWRFRHFALGFCLLPTARRGRELRGRVFQVTLTALEGARRVQALPPTRNWESMAWIHLFLWCSNARVTGS